MLLTYYLFLVVSAVLLAAFSGSSVFLQPRRSHIAYLLMPPIILVQLLLNLGFLATALVTVMLIVFINAILRRYATETVTSTTISLSIALVAAEAIVPLAIHLALQSRPDAERWSLFVSGLFFSLATLLIFVVWAPDVTKKT